MPDNPSPTPDLDDHQPERATQSGGVNLSERPTEELIVASCSKNAAKFSG